MSENEVMALQNAPGLKNSALDMEQRQTPVSAISMTHY